MSLAYDGIIKILAKIENEENLPSGTLKKIYDVERDVVHLLARDQIHINLRNIVVDVTSKVK